MALKALLHIYLDSAMHLHASRKAQQQQVAQGFLSGFEVLKAGTVGIVRCGKDFTFSSSGHFYLEI